MTLMGFCSTLHQPVTQMWIHHQSASQGSHTAKMHPAPALHKRDWLPHYDSGIWRKWTQMAVSQLPRLRGKHPSIRTVNWTLLGSSGPELRWFVFLMVWVCLIYSVTTRRGHRAACWSFLLVGRDHNAAELGLSLQKKCRVTLQQCLWTDRSWSSQILLACSVSLTVEQMKKKSNWVKHMRTKAPF